VGDSETHGHFPQWADEAATITFWLEPKRSKTPGRTVATSLVDAVVGTQYDEPSTPQALILLDCPTESRLSGRYERARCLI
jgi:hypothetical protein